MRIAPMFAAAAALAAAASAQTIELKVQRTPEQRAADFDAADANKDGKLDPAEFRKAVPPEIASQLPDEAITRLRDERDSNHDGFVDRAEFLKPGRVAIHQ